MLVVPVAALALLGTLTGPATATSPDTYDARARSGYEAAVMQELVSLHDDLRADPGSQGFDAPSAPPLTIANDVQTVAVGWSQELADTNPCGNTLCHNMPPDSALAYYDEFDCEDGYGENVAWQIEWGTSPPDASDLAASIMEQWRTSATHRATMLEPSFDEVGIGVHVRSFNDPDYGQSWEVFAVADFRDRNQDCTPASETQPPASSPTPSESPAPGGTPAPGESPPSGSATPPPSDDGSADGSATTSPASAGTSSVPRISGADRIATSIAVAEQFAASNTVLIASARNYPDALAAAPLAGIHDAPVLLSDGARLDTRVRQAIEDLGATTVILVGGTGALSETVAADARNLPGVTGVTRIAGASRWDTAAQLARLVASRNNWDGTLILVEGNNASPARGWPDALAASSAAARSQTPILLTNAHSLPAETAAALRDLNVRRLLVIGGEGAVSAAVMDAAGAAAGVAASRWSGDSRFATSMEVDRQSGFEATAILLATGLGWADALSAGPLAAHMNGTLLLVHGTDPSSAGTTAGWVAERHPDSPVTIVGGAGAVENQVAVQFD